MQQTKDGKKKFGSAYAAKRYDSAHTAEDAEPRDEKDAKKRLGGVLESESDKLESETGMKQHEPKDEQEHPVVTEHGPAHTVVIHHSKEHGKHTVTSHHDDGHTEMSEHEDAKTAHEEGGKMANVSLKKSGEAEDQQLAESEGGNDNAPDGFQMPDLA